MQNYLNGGVWELERKIAVASARTKDDLDAAFAILVHRSADALFVINDPYFSSIRGQIVALAAHYALPAACFSRYFPAAGGLMSYGTDVADPIENAPIISVAFSRARSRPIYRSCRRSSSSW